MEETEFEHIAQEMRPRLTAHCQRYLSAGTLAEEADDIVQETPGEALEDARKTL